MMDDELDVFGSVFLEINEEVSQDELMDILEKVMEEYQELSIGGFYFKDSDKASELRDKAHELFDEVEE